MVSAFKKIQLSEVTPEILNKLESLFVLDVASCARPSVVAHTGSFIAVTIITTAHTVADIGTIPNIARLRFRVTVVESTFCTTVGSGNGNTI